MKIQSIRNILFYSIPFFLMQFSSSYMYGMDKPEKHDTHEKQQSIKNSLMEKEYDYEQDRLRLVLELNPVFFDRKMIRLLSEVSSTCYSIVELTRKHREKYNDDRRAWVLLSSEERKNRFLDLMSHLKDVKRLVWNESNTVCATDSYRKDFLLYPAVEKESPSHRMKIVERRVERLSIFNAEFIPDYKTWRNINTLPHIPLVCFDGKKNVSFYGYGYGSDDETHILECKFFQKEKENEEEKEEKDIFICATQINKKVIPLIHFLEFPGLLKAFLASDKKFYLDTGEHKIFELDGVNFPSDYTQYKPFKYYVSRYKSFKKLPIEIREAIIARYAQQSQDHPPKEKKKGLLSCFGA